MLTLSLDKAGKKFGREWIFRNLDLELPPGSRLAILGGNGSGKSTLLQLVAGYVSPNEGSLVYKAGGKVIEEDARYSFVSFASPYLQLTEDFTGLEMTAHVQKFKTFLHKMVAEEVLKIANLEHAKNKLIKHYSSGMKQRLKLALAILADTPLLLLDEPLSNLDREGFAWYQEMISKTPSGRTIVVCSNSVTEEFSFCTERLQVSDHKK